MEAQVLIPKEAEKTIGEIESGLAKYEAYSITDQQTFDSAGEILKNISAQEKQIKEIRLSITKPMDEAKKKVMDFFSKPEELCARIKSLMSRKMTGYAQEQERIRQAAEAKLRDEQKKAAEKLEKKADKLEEKGKTDQADLVRQEAINKTNLQPTIASNVEKPLGVRKLVNWKFRITNPAALPREYLVADESAIGKVVKALKENTKIPGVEVYSEESFSPTGR